MASDEGLRAGGSGAGREKKPPAGDAPESSANGGPTAAPKAAPASALGPAAPKATPASALGKAPENNVKKPAEGAPAPRSRAAPAPADRDDLVVVTLKASTGSIVSVEMATPDGARHALTDSETARLVGERPTFASLVHDAFEAGIACVLDDGASSADERSGETEEDVDLHDALLDALIERSAAKRLLSRETLHSAVLGTIIHAASGKAKAAAPAA
jgi:hypothetical protein